MKNFKNTLTNKMNNLRLFFQLTAFAIFGIVSLFSGQALAQQQICTPNATVTEDHSAPGGFVFFVVTSGPGSVTIDHINAGSGMQSLRLVSSSNAVVNIPTFASTTLAPVTFAPVTVDFTINYPNLPVDFTLRAANATSAIFIRVRCACVPPLIITDDPSMFPGGPDSFQSITAGTNTITVHSIDGGSGLQGFSMVSAMNAVLDMPVFKPGSHQPETATFTVINLRQPVEFILRATNEFHGVLIKVLIISCGSSYVTDDFSPGNTDFFEVMLPTPVTPSGTITVNTVKDETGLQSLTVVNSSNAVVDIPDFTPGTLDPVTATYSKIHSDTPSCIILKATSNLHSIYIVLCSC